MWFYSDVTMLLGMLLLPHGNLTEYFHRCSLSMDHSGHGVPGTPLYLHCYTDRHNAELLSRSNSSHVDLPGTALLVLDTHLQSNDTEQHSVWEYSSHCLSLPWGSLFSSAIPKIRHLVAHQWFHCGKHQTGRLLLINYDAEQAGEHSTDCRKYKSHSSPISLFTSAFKNVTQQASS